MCVYMHSRFVENHPIRILEDGPLISEGVLSHWRFINYVLATAIRHKIINLIVLISIVKPAGNLSRTVKCKCVCNNIWIRPVIKWPVPNSTLCRLCIGMLCTDNCGNICSVYQVVTHSFSQTCACFLW
jgi:hypothetical protein